MVGVKLPLSKAPPIIINFPFGIISDKFNLKMTILKRIVYEIININKVLSQLLIALLITPVIKRIVRRAFS